jgi:hypothetical protein
MYNIYIMNAEEFDKEFIRLMEELKESLFRVPSTPYCALCFREDIAVIMEFSTDKLECPRCGQEVNLEI